MGNVWSTGIYAVHKNYLFNQPLLNPITVFNAKKLRLHKKHVHTYADPFLFVHDGFLYIFLEIQQIGSKGHIHCWRTSDLKDWSDLGCILREPFHLSYPFIFKDEVSDKIFLLPESSEERKIFLYEFESFPHKFSGKTTILDGNYADSNIHYYKGLYYLSTLNQDIDQFQLFFTENLKAPWTEHPSSPIQSKFPRNGGGFFNIKNKLFRAAQNTQHHYGEGIVILEVKDLTKTAYSEQIVTHDFRPGKDFPWQNKGRHHFSIANYCDQTIIAIDGLQKDFLINKALNFIYKFKR